MNLLGIAERWAAYEPLCSDEHGTAPPPERTRLDCNTSDGRVTGLRLG